MSPAGNSVQTTSAARVPRMPREASWRTRMRSAVATIAISASAMRLTTIQNPAWDVMSSGTRARGLILPALARLLYGSVSGLLPPRFSE